MSTEELHVLTGAYALNALSFVERREFERHLAACPACSLEVRELTATAEVLGRAAAVPPPAALRERVLRRVATVRQEPPRPDGAAHPGGRAARWRRGLPRLALAACLAAAALGGVAVWQHQEAREARQEARQAEQRAAEIARVLAAPDAAVATGELPGGATGTVVVSRSADRVVFLATGMPPAPSGHAYQLWYERGGEMRPAGLMRGGETGQAVLMEGALGDATGMGITVEPAEGSPQPTTEPLAVMEFPA